MPISSGPAESPYTCPTPEPQKITGAVLGLQLEYDATGSGSDIMVPTWFFTVDGSTYPTTVIAVDPSFLGDQAIPPVGVAFRGQRIWRRGSRFCGGGPSAAGQANGVGGTAAAAKRSPSDPGLGLVAQPLARTCTELRHLRAR